MKKTKTSQPEKRTVCELAFRLVHMSYRKMAEEAGDPSKYETLRSWRKELPFLPRDTPHYIMKFFVEQTHLTAEKLTGDVPMTQGEFDGLWETTEKRRPPVRRSKKEDDRKL